MINVISTSDAFLWEAPLSSSSPHLPSPHLPSPRRHSESQKQLNIEQKAKHEGQ